MDTPTARSLGGSIGPHESKMPDNLPATLADASNPHGQLTAACLILGIDQKTLIDRSKEFKTVKDRVWDPNGLLHSKSFQALAPLAGAHTPDKIKRTRKKIVKDAFDLKYETVQTEDLAHLMSAQEWLNKFIDNNCYLIPGASLEGLIFSELSDVEKKNFITSLINMSKEDLTRIVDQQAIHGIGNLLEIYPHLSGSNEHAYALLKIKNAIKEKNTKSRERLNSLLVGTEQEEIISTAEALQIRQQQLFEEQLEDKENKCKAFRKGVQEFENDVMRATITRSIIWNNKGKIVFYFFVGAIVGMAFVAGGLLCVLLATGTAMALVTAAAIVATIGTIAGLVGAGIRVYNKPTRIFQEPQGLVEFANSLTDPLERPRKPAQKLLGRGRKKAKTEREYYEAETGTTTPELQGELPPAVEWEEWASSAKVDTSSRLLSEEERRKQQRAQQRTQLTPEEQLMCLFYDLHDAAREKKYFGKQAPRWWHAPCFTKGEPATFEDVIIHALKNPTNSDGTGGNLTAQIFYQVCGFPVDQMYTPAHKDHLQTQQKIRKPSSYGSSTGYICRSQEEVLPPPDRDDLREALETAWIDFRENEKVVLDRFHEKHKEKKDIDANQTFLCFFKRPTHSQVKNECVDAYLPSGEKIQTQRSLVEIIDKSRSSNCMTLFFKRMCPSSYTGNRSATVLAEDLGVDNMDIRDTDKAKTSSEQLTKRLITG